MVQWASFAQNGMELINSGDVVGLGEVMKKNFQLRKEIFGEAALGRDTLRMIEIADGFGFAAKFTGRGGAIACLHTQLLQLSPEKENEVRVAYENEGYKFERINLHRPSKAWSEF